MSIISAGTSANNTLLSTGDSNGNLIIQTGASLANAAAFNADQSTSFYSNIREKVTATATAMTGTVNFDTITQSILYYTSNASANATLNFRGSSTVSLNTMMAVGESLSVVFMNTNGSTAYYPNAFTIDGTSVTPKWQGGTAPSSGNASAIDAYGFTIIKTGSATYTVLASQTKFS